MSGLRRSLMGVAMLVAVASPVSAQTPAPAGHIEAVVGTALIVRQNATVAAKAGDPIYATDTLRTAADGTLGVTLQDDTRVSLGPNSEMRVDRYVYSPGEG